MPFTTLIERQIQALPEVVYQLLIDRDAIAHWKVPRGMTCVVHAFEPRVGGTFRVSLTYESPDAQGKTSAHTDTYHGLFAALQPSVLVVEVIEFETTNPAMAGEMQVTYQLFATNGGTVLKVAHADVPDGVSPADNEYGWRMSLNQLAAIAEARS